MEGSEACAERMNGRSAHERGRFGELSRFARRFKWTKSADPDRCLQWRFYHKARQTLCGELWIHVTRPTTWNGFYRYQCRSL